MERMRFHDEMEVAHKEAQKKSIFRNLAQQSTILYGHRSITHFRTPDQTYDSVEINLKEHSATFEWPRMTVIDPVFLDYMLRLFRVERQKS
jgi:hypothetical protein